MSASDRKQPENLDTMAFEDIEAEIGLLLSRLIDHPKDAAEAAVLLREKLNEMRAYGMPLPQDLVELEQALEEQSEIEGIARRRLGRDEAEK